MNKTVAQSIWEMALEIRRGGFEIYMKIIDFSLNLTSAHNIFMGSPFCKAKGNTDPFRWLKTLVFDHVTGWESGGRQWIETVWIWRINFIGINLFPLSPGVSECKQCKWTNEMRSKCQFHRHSTHSGVLGWRVDRGGYIWHFGDQMR